MSTAPVLVQHPEFPTTVYEVPADKVKEWTDAGWSRVKRDDEAQVREASDLPPAE